MRDNFERLRSLRHNLQTEISTGFHLVDTLDFGGKCTPRRESTSMQDQLGRVNGAGAVARGNLTLTLGEVCLCEAV